MLPMHKAQPKDLDELCAFYEHISRDMMRRGLTQWQWPLYPNREILREDLALGSLYVHRVDDRIIAAVGADRRQDIEYSGVNWLFGIRPGGIHRVAVAPEYAGHGLGNALFEFALHILRDVLGCDAMRGDTCVDNEAMNRIYRRAGMRNAGYVHFPDCDKPFPCYELPLKEHCPMLPLRMTPAFRSGALTPWGGDRLKRGWNKQIPQVPTGESLEVSCIPGFESRDDTGVPLPELIRAYGTAFAGKYAREPFPLLLKLIDAQDNLSVQVHPNDAYAARYENGKLGKTEAWLILESGPESSLVYGMQPGITLESLRAASEYGPAVQPLLRRTHVVPGDICYIPAGCVHTIGSGIVLYEIQQSSDVTYRFYDWDRVDNSGKGRELHIQKALDVTDLTFAEKPIHMPENIPYLRVLDKEYFSLDIICPGEASVSLPLVQDFGMVTALDEGMILTWFGGFHTLRKGETVYIPAASPALAISGCGKAALAMPK